MGLSAPLTSTPVPVARAAVAVKLVVSPLWLAEALRRLTVTPPAETARAVAVPLAAGTPKRSPRVAVISA